MSERPRDLIWDMLTEYFGDVNTASERGRRNVAVKELREAGATPEEVKIACDWCFRQFPGCTEIAIAAHFSRAQFEHKKYLDRTGGNNVVSLVHRMAQRDLESQVDPDQKGES